MSRYYIASGAGGLAVAVHTTQFAIRDPRAGLFEPVLRIAQEEMDRACAGRAEPLVRIGGICGQTRQAEREAALLRELKYHAGLLSLGAFRGAPHEKMLEHCRVISGIIPIIGFYLQPAAGGRILPYAFWRGLLELPGVAAVKIAPFNRYYTIDVVRAVADSGRTDVALYTGNDDNIINDLLSGYRFPGKDGVAALRIVGGLLGHWAVWTKKAVEIFRLCRRTADSGAAIPAELLRLNIEVTDANAAFFDAANNFRGCIAGVHEALRRQGLLEGIWCLDPQETLSAGQAAEIERVWRMYPHLNDDEFVTQHRDEWLR